MTNCSRQCKKRNRDARFAAVLRRRDFIRTFALFSAASSIAGRDVFSFLVADVHAQASTAAGLLSLDLTTPTLAALRNDFGSVRIRVSGMPTSFSQIVITRVPGNQFFAVSSRCTHEAITVNPYSATLGAIRCPQHGSLFQPDGTVIAGPATQPLPSYPTVFNGVAGLTIEIPGAGFSAALTGPTTNTAGEARVRLEFPTVTGVRYDVRFRSSLADGAWAAVPFATSLDGALTLNTLTGNNTRATVFVAPPSEIGFYAIVRTS